MTPRFLGSSIDKHNSKIEQTYSDTVKVLNSLQDVGVVLLMFLCMDANVLRQGAVSR